MELNIKPPKIFINSIDPNCPAAELRGRLQAQYDVFYADIDKIAGRANNEYNDWFYSKFTQKQIDMMWVRHNLNSAIRLFNGYDGLNIKATQKEEARIFIEKVIKKLKKLGVWRQYKNYFK